MAISWINKRRSLEEEKEHVRRLIEQERIARQSLGVPWNGHLVQTDDHSITNIIASQSAIQAGIAPSTISWRMDSNESVEMTHAEFTQMAAAVFAYCEDCYQVAFAHKDAVNALQTYEAVEAYAYQGGWP